MSTNAKPDLHDTPLGRRDQMLTYVMMATVVVYFGLLLTNIDAFTTDAMWRANAEFSFMPFAWILGAFTACSIITLTLFSKGRPRLAVAAFWITSAFVSWLMVTNLHSIDVDGKRNPYVRAKDAYAESYAQLAPFRNDPRIAPMIRRAKADGRITRGEAYDILHSAAYDAAWTDAQRAEDAKNRNAVLSTR